ncbi:transposase [Rufibacter tibetensis]|uniref:Transposase IS200-like domain-containing protein n=1 Tax=Rufibacter tibetensis TaxID=512763 RepID=A0A0P0D178_9BACT|nr:transposase [Rufibacter tibetensis]ALJ00798.1 hypothetical protein DC20_19680 [Rufibacter tibetensis]
MRPDRKRNRLLGFDYSQDAFYFVTCCVKEMACVFGEVINEEMHLNQFGQIAERQWFWLLEQYPYLSSHAFVVMPNHVHAILEINKQGVLMLGEDQECEGTGRDLSVLLSWGGRKVKSLSQIMGAYKTTTSKLIRLAGMPDFAWHRSFHDHIIRDEKSFRNIKHYIENNPAKWEEDTFRR